MLFPFLNLSLAMGVSSMLKEQNIHYFPGHMRKALKDVANYVKLVDLVIEIVDSRAPKSSRNPYLKEIIGNKTHLLFLSKEDYSDPKLTQEWLSYFSNQGLPCLAGNLKKGGIMDKIRTASIPLFAAKREKEARLGMKKQPLRLMVIGVPNVGKSTFINSLKGKGKAKVANKAGFTRSEQWIKVNDDFILLDTPGILPMNYLDKEQAIKLAMLGTMREDVLPQVELAEHFYDYLQIEYPASLALRFEINDISNLPYHEALLKIATKRGLLENGSPSIEKAAYLLVKEFKDGILGRFSLEKVDA